MPKASKKASLADELLHQAAPMTGIEAGTEGGEQQHAAAAAGEEQAGPKPKFAPLTSYELNGKRIEFRRVPVPQNRLTPLKNNWLALYKPVTENLKLDMRMNLKTRKVGRGGLAAPAGGGAGALCRAPESTIHPSLLCFRLQVEIKTTPDTPDAGNLQRAADFVHAFILGFEVQVRRGHTTGSSQLQ